MQRHMRLCSFVFLFFGSVSTLLASSGGIEKDKLKLYGGDLSVPYGMYTPHSVPIVADGLYLHGFGDRFSNHEKLFKTWAQAGVRTIAFDFPDHGETCSNALSSHLDFFTFEELSFIATQVMTKAGEKPWRPLLLAGWSTGGLLAIRMAQATLGFHEFARHIHGLVLFAPAVRVPYLVGERGKVTNQTLTQDTELWARDIEPGSPLCKPVFASRILDSACRSWKSSFPQHIRTLVLAASDDDKYINTGGLKQWVDAQRAHKGSEITAVQYPQSMHEIDNEHDLFGGQQTRELARDFIEAVAKELPFNVNSESVLPRNLF